MTTKDTTNVRVLLSDLYRFKAQAALRHMTMMAPFTRVCDELADGLHRLNENIPPVETKQDEAD